MKIDWLSVYQAACRANMAYEMDPARSEAGFSSLGQGLTWLGMYQKGADQAVACIDQKGEAYLSISGTRFGKGFAGLMDLADDAMLMPHSLGGGVYVTAGAFLGLEPMWQWAQNLVPPGTVWNVEGHSLGAWRTRYTPVFLAPDRIGKLHSFESPKAANAAYWKKYHNELSGMVSIINDRDLFVSWPFASELWCHPERLPVQWITRLLVTEILPDGYPGGISISDHSMTTVQSKCRFLAGV